MMLCVRSRDWSRSIVGMSGLITCISTSAFNKCHVQVFENKGVGVFIHRIFWSVFLSGYHHFSANLSVVGELGFKMCRDEFLLQLSVTVNLALERLICSLLFS